MSVHLLVGDCLDVMAGLPTASCDAFVMDPPYTTAGGSSNGRSGGHAIEAQFFTHWLRDVMAQIRRVVKPTGCGFAFCDWRTVGVVADAILPRGSRQREQVWTVTQALVWDRESIGLGSPFRNSFEMIAFARGPEYRSALPKDIPNVIRHRWTYGRHEHHGAEKPLELCRQLVRWALPSGGVVLDPFAGSGTVAVACQLEGRGYCGIEVDEHDVATATRRLSEATHQHALVLGGAA